MNFTKKTLKNGLTVILAPMKDNLSVTVLVMVHTGSKYEKKEENGLSHFLEHMCFKGTVKRPRALDISLELDSIGSQNNAFTAQEFTGYYAKSHPSHLSTILDVVSDIYINPVFDTEEIEKEKGVIMEEMNMYEDTPHRLVRDYFMEAMYGDQPAGWWIIGTKENILRTKREDFLRYRNEHYVANATTVIVSGNFNESNTLDQIEKLFEKIPTTPRAEKLSVVENQTNPIIKIRHKETDQTHLVLGLRAFSAKEDKKNYSLKVLNAIIGGGMSSRLFQKLREEIGAGYYVSSEVDEYTDHGFLAISTGVDNLRVKEVVDAILNELKRFTVEKVDESELKKAKDYMVGNMYLGLESSDSVAEYYAIQDILGDEIITPDDLVKKIQEITSEDVMNVANEIMQDNRLVMAIVGNVKNKEELEKDFHF